MPVRLVERLVERRNRLARRRVVATGGAATLSERCGRRGIASSVDMVPSLLTWHPPLRAVTSRRPSAAQDQVRAVASPLREVDFVVEAVHGWRRSGRAVVLAACERRAGVRRSCPRNAASAR
jgi:hypothetical protein